MTTDAGTLLALCAASAVGAVARCGVDRWVGGWISGRLTVPVTVGDAQDDDRWSTAATLPWGIAIVNLSGCLLMGLLVGVAGGGALDGARWVLTAQVGVLGSYTTFSTWAVDVVRLLEQGRGRAAVLNAVGSLVLGAGAAALGLAAGTAVGG